MFAVYSCAAGNCPCTERLECVRVCLCVISVTELHEGCIKGLVSEVACSRCGIESIKQRTGHSSAAGCMPFCVTFHTCVHCRAFILVADPSAAEQTLTY